MRARFNLKEGISDEAKDLMMKMLEKDPRQRFGV